MPSYSRIINPKRHLDSAEAEGRKLFPYYAGFSSSFVDSVFETLEIPNDSVILDPWNGSGTTTNTSLKHDYSVIGSDLNPAMIIVAKASLVSKFDIDSLLPLAHSIIKKSTKSYAVLEQDPLLNWFDSRSAEHIRKIESSINSTLVSHTHYVELGSSEGLEKTTPIAAFFYLSLFRSVRRMAASFVASNPTWTKVGKTPEEKVTASKEEIFSSFLTEVTLLGQQHKANTSTKEVDTTKLKLLLSNAESLPLSENSIGAVITSPPYCTRIDYAIATYIELALIRVGAEKFSLLRRELTGSSTVPKSYLEERIEWGPACLEFLESLKNHPSKASQTYYLKNHTKYFDSLYKSLNETARVLKPNAPCVLVVQNSYYKEIRNDVALIISQMAQGMGLKLNHQADFVAARSMVDLNKKSKSYINKRHTVESVLILEKN
ncbi:DNA methylase [Pseudomonas sp. GD03862]|uniref:DNA methylase n=1 Tax=Pseudomonas sp. GD03862 TaxID=2975391 RepID=UPI00244D6715|nr:DNA methylase [Pseudomonas sp. GD03862]MDH0708113.1 DNA methylase [Pseudomonas sp. GD03862]